ncbi:MAG: PQQ-binding-like beta-propeller repeat protein [Coriobacteriaceae bacterium]|nr:PQQ-binding-like beta-propeller repeat protein [Coriobacteriaceae bacterium]
MNNTKSSSRTKFSKCVMTLLAVTLCFGLTPAVAFAQGKSSSVASPTRETIELSAEGSLSSQSTSEVFSVTVTGLENIGSESTAFDWIPNMEYPVSGSTTALDATAALLTAAGYSYNAPIGYLDSITTPDSRTLGSVDTGGGNWSYWSFFINGEMAQVGAGDYYPSAGDHIAWVYYDATGSSITPSEPELNPNADRPMFSSMWPSFTGYRNTAAQTPIASNTIELAWTYYLAGDAEWAKVSDPIIVDNYIYIAADSTIYKINRKSGALSLQASLAGSIDYTCRPLYADGVVVVPLSGGRLQAFTASALESAWITPTVLPDPTYGSHQAVTTLTYADGYVQMGTAVADWETSYSGIFQSVNIDTGAIRWRYSNDSAGFYWSGGVQVGNIYYVADDDGVIFSFDAVTGNVKKTLSLDNSVRSTLVAADGVLYATTVAGDLCAIALNADGSFGKLDIVDFAASSSSTPTICGTNIFVGGSAADYTGILAVIDTTSLEVTASIAAPASVMSAPVVSTQGDEAYVYFTYNAQPGGIMVYRLGDTEATDLYVPNGDLANYCMSSPIVGTDGMLYYTNDSGNLFALSPAWERLAGNNRYGTAAAIVENGWSQSNTVIVATGANFPDALAASSLAGLYDAPVVLVGTDVVPERIATALTDTLMPTDIIIVGGPSAISETNAAQLEALTGASIQRYEGTNRYGTALDIYNKEQSKWGTTEGKKAIVVAANGYADALSIAPYAFAENAPIFLTDSQSGLDDQTTAAINAGGFDTVILVGLTAAVPEIVDDQITTQTFRIGGANRYETSALVANWAAENSDDLDYNKISVAIGSDFPDALAGGAFAGHKGSILILAADYPNGRIAINDVIKAHASTIGHG